MKRRNTIPQEAVLSILTSSRKAMSQDAIEKKMEIDVDRATIYRVLNRFCDDGVVQKIVADDGKQYFAVCQKNEDMNIPVNHFHFRCTSCQTIQCLSSQVEYSIPNGFNVEKLNCVLIGICSECSVNEVATEYV